MNEVVALSFNLLVLPVAVKTLHPRNQLMREWVWFC